MLQSPPPSPHFSWQGKIGLAYPLILFLGQPVINTTGEYALRAIVAIAQAHPNSRTTAQLANITKVPAGYLSKVLQSLTRAGLITSQRGLGGGFLLAQPARRIRTLDVLEAVGAAPQRITKCPLGIVGHTELCPVHRMLDDAIARTEKALTAADLETLCRSTNGIQPLCE